jgi:Xaa-Pro aminopeptidase
VGKNRPFKQKMDLEGESETFPLVSSVRAKKVSLVGAGALVAVLALVLVVLFIVWATTAVTPAPLLPQCSVANYRDILAVAPWQDNRAQLLQLLIANMTAQERGVALLYGNSEQSTGDGDTTVLFRQNSNFLYLVGYSEVPDLVLAMDVRTGRTTLFVTPLDEVWNGENLSLEQWAQKARVDATEYISALPDFLGSNSAGGTLFVLPGVAVPSNWTGAVDATRLDAALGKSRVVKTAGELDIMQRVATAASGAHEAVMRGLLPSNSEYEAEAYYLDQCYACLLRRTGYTGIFASAYSSAILHYVDNSKSPFTPGSFILIDAGGEFAGYDTDITRTLPVSGVFSALQRSVYEAVLEAQATGERACSAGVTFANMSAAVTQSLATSLFQLGFIASADRSLVRYFCPHDYFHTVGLDVHDTSLPSGAALPVNAVITIEPGVYFNRVLFSDAAYKANPGLIRAAIEPLVTGGFGGVRIEDTYVVQQPGCKALSSAPKTVAQIEAAMRK